MNSPKRTTHGIQWHKIVALCCPILIAFAASSAPRGRIRPEQGKHSFAIAQTPTPSPTPATPTPSLDTTGSPTPSPSPQDTRPQDELTPAPLSTTSGNDGDVPTGSPSKSPAWLQTVTEDCTNGDFFACSLLTEAFLDGQLIFHNTEIADALLKQSCDTGSLTSCQRLGIASPIPFPFPAAGMPESDFLSNYQAVVNERDCVLSGNPSACYLAGVAYLDGVGVPQDKPRAAKFLTQACTAGTTQACRELECSQAKPESCFSAGTAYVDGQGVASNLKRGRLLLSRACDLGNTPACTRLTTLTTTTPPLGAAVKEVISVGSLMPLTLAQARTCDAGLGMGCRNLARLFELGMDVPKDLERASSYYQQACTSGAGDASSCTRLGDMLARGDTEVANQTQAEEFYKRAAQLNQTGVDLGVPPEAAFNLAEAYAKGQGVAKNLTKARELYELSCNFFQSGAACRRMRELQNNIVEQSGPEERALPSEATALIIFYARDCDGGGLGSCTSLGQFYAKAHGVPRDLEHAATLLKRACQGHLDFACSELSQLPSAAAAAGFAGLCESGSTDACVSAGDHFASAGADFNLDMAAGYYETACMKQSSKGCSGLISTGDRFRDGQNVSTDVNRASAIYRTACILEHAEGCGRLVEIGRTWEVLAGTANEDRAIQNYSEACRSGNFVGCQELWRLANKYQTSNPPNLPRSRAIWKASCSNYSAIVGVCNNFAVMLERGEGGPKDETQALLLYDRDCRRGSSLACTNFYNLDGTLHTETWVFNPPNVGQRVTEYKSNRFREYDEVYVRAGGCVQTGGIGKTWKRFVNPSGANSDRLYHGTIWVPGATGPMETLQGVVGKVLRIPAAPHHDTTNYFLRLGFEDEDDKYGDNNFNDFDEGTDHQCANTENAWVVIYVRHHSKPPPVAPTPQLLPMDLWWDSIDDNLFPLNPMWGAQVGHRGVLPDAGSACNYFNNEGDRLSLGSNCTSQRPTVDETSILENRVNFFICHANIDQHDNLPGSSVHGHVNWYPVSYTGKIYFDDFQDPFLGSLSMPFGTGDDDYDWALIRDGEEGVLAGNKFQYHNSGKHGLTLEFDSREVIDNISSPWWNSLHSAVDSHPAHYNDWTAAQSLVDGRDAIVIGLMGVDTKHTYHAELHPVFAMAIKISEGGNRERWAIFARNWGDEGGCSQEQHYLPGRTVSLFFPNEGGQDLTIDDPHTGFAGFRAPVVWGAKNYSDGMVLTFNLPAPESQGMVFGEIEFCRGLCNGSALLVSAPLMNLVAAPVSAPSSSPSPTPTPTPANSAEADEEPHWTDEGSLEPLLKKLTPEQQKKFSDLLKQTPTPMLAHRAGPSSLMFAAQRDDNIAITRHRKLSANEARIPVNAQSKLDTERVALFRRIYEALKQAVGGQLEADKLLSELK